MNAQSRPQTIQEMADLLGRYRYVELAFFAIAGRGVLRSSEAALAVHLSHASHAHAYRAELIERRLLVSDGLEHAPESTRAPSTEHERLFESYDQLSAKELAAVLALAWYPAMLDAYRSRLVNCDRASEGPIRLMLSRVIFDLEATMMILAGAFDHSPFASQMDGVRGAIAGVGGAFGTLRL